MNGKAPPGAYPTVPRQAEILNGCAIRRGRRQRQKQRATVKPEFCDRRTIEDLRLADINVLHVLPFPVMC